MDTHTQQAFEALRMQQAADRSALLVLAHHLQQAGLVSLAVLAAELQHIGRAQLEPGWQAAHEALAQALAQSSCGARLG